MMKREHFDALAQYQAKEITVNKMLKLGILTELEADKIKVKLVQKHIPWALCLLQGKRLDNSFKKMHSF